MIGTETLWACTTCGYCEAACPIELEHLDKFFRMRQHQVMIEGEFPHELKKLFEAYESQGNPWGLQADARGDWAQGLDVPVVRTAADLEGLDFLFYVGSAMSFDPRGQRIARAFVKILRRGGVRFGILGAREGSTGESVRRVGNEMLFQQLASALVATLAEVGATRIVTCDPHALNSLRNEYPELGGHYEVLHHTQLIAELLADGRIEIEASAERIVYHDPCYLGRHNGEFDAPRAILARLAPRRRSSSRWPREGNVLRRRRRPDVDRRDHRHAHQRPAGRAGARDLAADDRDRLPLLRGDDGGRPGGAPRRGHDAVARHRRAGGGRTRRRGAGAQEPPAATARLGA